jgi:hypothetical protein
LLNKILYRLFPLDSARAAFEAFEIPLICSCVIKGMTRATGFQSPSQETIKEMASFAKHDNFYHPKKDDGLFCSDWRKGAVFSQLISGGNRRPRFIGAMRKGQNSPMDTLLKKQAREPRN